VQTRESAHPENNSGEIIIRYRGEAAQATAAGLQNKLEGAGLPVAPLATNEPDDSRLGAAEIAIALVLAPLAKAAAKAMLLTTIGYLQDYLTERVSGGENTDCNLQLVIKSSEQPRSKRFPFSLRGATLETVTAFCEQVKKAVEKL
jgi:hypothetical protein